MQPYLWALLTACVWGCVPIIEKLGLTKLSVFVGLFYRSIGVILGAVILFAFNVPGIKQAFFNEPRGWIFVLLGGLAASVLGQLFFYHALKYGEASQVVPMAAAYPLISFILGIIFLGENFTLQKMFGIFSVLIGIWLLK